MRLTLSTGIRITLISSVPDACLNLGCLYFRKGWNEDGKTALNRSLDASTFRNHYYLKEELVRFCRASGLPVTGGKTELTERIACFLEGKPVERVKVTKVRTKLAGTLSEETLIESPFVCSEIHRAFFKAKTGSSFSFNVAFQKWLKSNAGKTYGDAIEA